MLRSGFKSFKQIFSKKKMEKKEPSIPPEIADASPEVADASPEVADDFSPEDDDCEQSELDQLKEELKQTKRRLKKAENKIVSLEEKLELSNQQTAKTLQILGKEFQLMKKTADERDAQLCTRMDQLEKVKKKISDKDNKDYQFFDAEKERATKLRRPPSKNRKEPKRKDDDVKRSETPDEKNNKKKHESFDPEKERAPKPRRLSSNDRSAPKRTDDTPVIRNDGADAWIQIGDIKKCDNASHDTDCLCKVTPDQFKRLETPYEKNKKREHQSFDPEKERKANLGRPSSKKSPQKRTDELRHSRNGDDIQTCDNDSHHLDCLCRLTPDQFKRFGIPDGNKKSNSK